MPAMANRITSLLCALIITVSIPLYSGPLSNNEEQTKTEDESSYFSLIVASGAVVVAGLARLFKYLRHQDNSPQPQVDHRVPLSLPKLDLQRLPIVAGSDGFVFDESRNKQTFNILIVDDERMMVMSPRRILEKGLGHRITWVQDGQGALAALESGEIFDLVLMDHHMLEMDGLQTTRLLREQGFQNRIVSHSTEQFTDETRDAYIALDVTEFFDKSQPSKERYELLLTGNDEPSFF